MSDDFNRFYNGAGFRPQASDPTNPIDGDVFFSNGTPRAKGFWKWQDGQWQVLGGSGGGGLDVFFKEDHEINGVTDYTTGNDAIVDNGGTLDGAVALETSAPLSKLQSAKYTMGSSSTDDFILGVNVALDEKQKNKEIAFTQYYKYNGADNDVKAFLYDVDNAEIIPGSNILLTAEANSKRLTIQAYIKDSIDNVKIGYQVLVGNSGKILIWDDIEGTGNPLVFTELTDVQSVHYDTHAGYGSTNNKIPHFTNARFNNGANIVTIVNSATDGFSITANRKCRISVNYSWNASGTTFGGWSLDSAQLTTSILSITAATRLSISSNASTATGSANVSIDLEEGQVFRPHSEGTATSSAGREIITISARADSEALVNSDTGTENNFAARITSADAITSQNEAFVASVTSSSTGIYVCTLTTSFFGAIPAFSAIAETASLYAAITAQSASSVTIQFRTDAGTLTDSNFVLKASRQGTDYKNPSAKAINPLIRTAYIKDIKSANTAGGTFTTGAFRTRDLNDLSGDTSFISLATNQFTLGAGKYQIEAQVAVYAVNRNVSKLRNITDSTDDIIGTSQFAGAAGDGREPSILIGEIEISSSKTFEIQHNCETTGTTTGFGLAANLGVTEVYTQVRITKVR